MCCPALISATMHPQLHEHTQVPAGWSKRSWSDSNKLRAQLVQQRRDAVLAGGSGGRRTTEAGVSVAKGCTTVETAAKAAGVVEGAVTHPANTH